MKSQHGPLGARAPVFCSAARHGNCFTVKRKKEGRPLFFHGRLRLHFFRSRPNAKNSVMSKNEDAPKSGSGMCLLGLAGHLTIVICSPGSQKLCSWRHLERRGTLVVEVLYFKYDLKLLVDLVATDGGPLHSCFVPSAVWSSYVK